jgi:hypothetical protein
MYQTLATLHLKMAPSKLSSKTGSVLRRGEKFDVFMPEKIDNEQRWLELVDGRGWVSIFDHAKLPAAGCDHAVHWTAQHQQNARVAITLTEQ